MSDDQGLLTSFRHAVLGNPEVKATVDAAGRPELAPVRVSPAQRRAQPIVFLDIDGVMVTPDSCALGFQDPLPGATERYPAPLSPECVAALNFITDQTNAVIVLSSVWRLIGWPDFRAIARHYGITAPVIDRTPHHGFNEPRGNEIQAWLTANRSPNHPIVILDDDTDMLHLAPHLIVTDAETGLTMGDAHAAIRTLKTTVFAYSPEATV